MRHDVIVPFLVTMMLVTGVCNTILNKYQVGHHRLLPASNTLVLGC